MTIPTSAKRALGLSVKEIALLNHLPQDSSTTISALARSIGWPRTSVRFLLRKLATRGLVRVVKVKNHREWQAMPAQTILKTVDSFLATFQQTLGIAGEIMGRDIGVSVYQGKRNIQTILQQTLYASGSSRQVVIQGNEAARLDIQNLDRQLLFDVHKMVKRRRIVIEGVIGESTLALFNSLDNKQLQSHLGRAVITYIVPDSFVDFSLDIILIGQTVLILNMKEQYVVVIHNRALVETLQRLINAVQAHSRRFDLNKHIRELLKTDRAHRTRV